jgi:hypothetical protein
MHPLSTSYSKRRNYLMQKVPDYREIETCISLANIKDQVSALLYAAGIVHDNEEVLNIKFSFDKYVDDGYGVDELIPITIKIKKHQEVDLVKHI